MRVVILGTGTDVGKSYVTQCLARGLAQKASVLALKPVESGVDARSPGDAGRIAQAAGHEPMLSPWRYARAVSPHLAAREHGHLLAVDALAEWVRGHQLRAHPAVALIETAGGAWSPLAPGVTNVDLALALEPALWLLVAPDALGVLHDVTATLRSLPRAPDAVLLSCARPSDESTGSNAAELSRLGICEVLEVLPEGATEAPLAVNWLRRHPSFDSGHT